MADISDFMDKVLDKAHKQQGKDRRQKQQKRVKLQENPKKPACDTSDSTSDSSKG